MPILKLQDGGPAVAVFVERILDDVSRKPGAKAQYKFAGRTATEGDVLLWAYTDTAERQFARIGLTREAAVGKWLAFSKTPTGYLDINLPSGTGAPTPTAPLAAPALGTPAPAAPSASPERATAAAKPSTR